MAGKVAWQVERKKVMSRELIFRAQVAGLKDIKPRRAYGGHCVVEGKHYIILDDAELTGLAFEDENQIVGFVEVIPKTVEQFTGLRDSKRTKEYPKGQMVFEGDKVKASIYGDEEPQLLEVQYREGGYVIDYEDSESDCVLVGWFVGNLEVIGNIHTEAK